MFGIIWQASLNLLTWQSHDSNRKHGNVQRLMKSRLRTVSQTFLQHSTQTKENHEALFKEWRKRLHLEMGGDVCSNCRRYENSEEVQRLGKFLQSIYQTSNSLILVFIISSRSFGSPFSAISICLAYDGQ